ncbi:endonuclease/exonuclease/phosphatase family protein [Desertivirga xinjiangensis]|uniref:endonuclease/exonuclease/phosphatase family protein n=1 Tax=Desertivirga xinjiangensis TaxID=539206 RepID=UPI00210E80EA|nr:endonuclease/exonuclease/phosphatase family protein [Pedobacter xinjiangensis]
MFSKLSIIFMFSSVSRFTAFLVVVTITSSLFSCKKEKEEVSVSQHEVFKILSYNVYEGFRGDQQNIANFKAWIDTVKPDVIALQEMKYFTKASLKSFALEMGYPHTLMFHESGLPVALVSRYPITDVKQVPSDLHLIQAKVLDYNLMVVHLSPLTYEKRRQEIELVLERCRDLAKDEKTLIMGDFNNMSPQDATFYNNSEKMALVRLSEANNPEVKILNNGNIDYSTIQALMDNGFYDSWKMFRNSYEKSAPTKLRSHNNYTRIDYIWLNEPLLNDYLKSYFIKDSFTHYLSDHYPMVLLLKK